ncbi:MAG: hypothetical protein ABL962_02290 [Fimbriimonadaceae bacterium]
MFARSYADRLILEKLTEMESAMKLSELADKLSGAGLGLASVRSLLASNPERFAYHERRWIPAARLEGDGRPMLEMIRLLVDRFGGPMPYRLIFDEVARILHKEVESIEDRVRRMVNSSPDLIEAPNETVSLADWAFTAEGEDFERALALHKLTQEELDTATKTLASVDWFSDTAIADALKHAPMSAKLIGAVAWSKMNSQDARTVLMYDGREMFAEMVSTEGFVYGADGIIHPESEVKKWLSTAIKVAEKLAPLVDIEDAAPIDVKPVDVAKMVGKIVKSADSITATKLLEEHYEITPSNKTFPDDMDNLMVALKEQKEIWWVGGDRFRKANSAPDFIESVPEPFQFIQTEFKDEEGELIDVELTDEGLSSTLRKLLVHPLAMDVVDEDIAPEPKQQPEQIRLVLKSIHRELGTFPMAQITTGWLDSTPNIQELIFVNNDGNTLQVWVNHEARLLYGLVDWWYDQPVESGSVFTLTKTTKPNVLEFAWDDQTDPVVFISNQRMDELREISSRAEELSTLDIIMEVMGHWPKGADFLTILAEINVVRRSSRRLVASILSSYQCFYQRSGSPVWHFDAKKIELGFDKAKRKFIKK